MGELEVGSNEEVEAHFTSEGVVAGAGRVAGASVVLV